MQRLPDLKETYDAILHVTPLQVSSACEQVTSPVGVGLVKPEQRHGILVAKSPCRQQLAQKLDWPCDPLLDRRPDNVLSPRVLNVPFRRSLTKEFLLSFVFVFKRL